LVLVIELS